MKGLTQVDMLVAGPYGGQRKNGTAHKVICKTRQSINAVYKKKNILWLMFVFLTLSSFWFWIDWEFHCCYLFDGHFSSHHIVRVPQWAASWLVASRADKLTAVIGCSKDLRWRRQARYLQQSTEWWGELVWKFSFTYLDLNCWYVISLKNVLGRHNLHVHVDQCDEL